MLLNVFFFGSSGYCLPVLESLRTHFALTGIITKKGQHVEKYALSHNIKVFTPKDKKELRNLKKKLSLMNPDLAIVADYGVIIPKEIFKIPRYKTLNIHFSKLPRFRGPSPVQYTILFGESAWISVIIMDEEIDTGDIIWQKEIPLINESTNYPIKETTESLYKKLFDIISFELPGIINNYINNPPAGGKPVKQERSQATYTKYFTREDGFVPSEVLECALKGTNPSLREVRNWPLNKIFPQKFLIHNSKFIIEKSLRAFSPWPGLWTQIQLTFDKQHLTKRLKILKAHLETGLLPDRKAKTIPDRKVRLVLDLVQLEGKKLVSWKQFQEGYPNAIFEV